MTKQLAKFIADLNQLEKHHIGYCGEKEEDILHDIQEIKPYFITYEYEGEIEAAIGLDIDEADRSAEVWGPFAKNHEVKKDLWNQVVNSYENKLQQLSFFVNEKNNSTLHFLQSINATHQGNHAILAAKRGIFQNICHSYHEQYRNDFLLLHEATFPQTYLSGEEILKLLDQHHKLLLLTENGQLQGYVYLEAAPHFGEGQIEFLTVCPKARKKGRGRQLIEAALETLFQFENIDKITLCVSLDNHQAIKLYQSAGFELSARLKLFSYQF
ncbi:N-acetyltransferase [Cytobacillus sp. FSL R5-0569]|uniref:GNAT family N-acetyltransferase n=1 Tax=Cytobacillus sp. FSL R5-0569 TaxID=2921649 RepID=UPI0030F798E1